MFIWLSPLGQLFAGSRFMDGTLRLNLLIIPSFLFFFLPTSYSLAECTKRLSTLRSAPRTKVETKVKKVFERLYFENYQQDECFENTMTFLEKVTPVSSKSFYLVSIENRGASTLGMVRAKKARGIEFEKENGNWKEVPASIETKWGHHVFAMDESFLIYDFDYTHQPKVLSLKTYLQNMFLDEPTDLRRKKLEDYQVVITRASFALKKEKDPKQKRMTLQEFWNLK